MGINFVIFIKADTGLLVHSLLLDTLYKDEKATASFVQAFFPFLSIIKNNDNDKRIEEVMQIEYLGARLASKYVPLVFTSIITLHLIGLKETTIVLVFSSAISRLYFWC